MEHIEKIENFTLRQDDTLPKLGIDSNLLSKFVTLRKNDKVLDLGCGVGVLAVLMALREPNITVDGIEINEQSAKLAEMNLRENNIKGQIINADIRSKGWFNEGNYNLIVSNPPYFQANSGFTATRRNAVARAELNCTLEDVCIAASKRLKTGGRFDLVCRVERLADLICYMRNNQIEPKKLAFFKPNEKKAPKIFLIEGIRQGNSGITICDAPQL